MKYQLLANSLTFMNFDKYIPSQIDVSTYQFTSVGKTNQLMQVSFVKKSENEEVYTLMFGNVDSNNSINYLNKTNNGDMKIILATVVKITENFLEENPSSIILFSGSSETRTKLYQRILSSNFTTFTKKIDIFGVENGKIEQFNPIKIYAGFIIRNK